MNEIELINKRKIREKHFLKKDGSIIANIYQEPVHFLNSKGYYEEIDNSIEKKESFYYCKKNIYNIEFNNESIIKIQNNKKYLKINIKNINKDYMIKYYNKTKLISCFEFLNILKNIDLKYEMNSNIIKENIILKKSDISLKNFIFEIETNMNIYKDDNDEIIIKNNDFCYKFEKPFMIDSNGKRNNSIFLNLQKVNVHNYIIYFNYDEAWLKNPDTQYPIVIDPTITEYNNENSVIDTYIYEGDTNDVRYNKDYIKVGKESNNSNIINRALLKFTLPDLGTGSQIIDSKLYLIGYPINTDSYDSEILNIHRINYDWDESSANWTNMHDKFDNLVESSFEAMRSFALSGQILRTANNTADVTLLVKSWYDGKPNYGMMIKSNDENQAATNVSSFFSKDNSIQGFNPKPLLQITYRNQTGIINYMNYLTTPLTNGAVYSNIYNGNLTLVNDIVNLSDSDSITLSLIYNTHDLILEHDYGLYYGYKFNLYQYIDDTDSNNIEYLDETSNIHYFVDSREYYDSNGEIQTEEETNVYYDEDGLGLKLIKYNSYYILTDNKGSKLKFEKTNNSSKFYLISIENDNGELTTITYNSNLNISKISSQNNSTINFDYFGDEIYISNGYKTVVLLFVNNKLDSINDSIIGETTFEYNSSNLITKINDCNGKHVCLEYVLTIPYRLNNIKVLGKYNSIESEYSLNYSFMATRISNGTLNKIYVFNQYGAIKSINNIDVNNDIRNMYGELVTYGEMFQDLNKVITKTLPIKHTKNYIDNSNFYSTANNFINEDGITSIVTSEQNNYGSNSLKIMSTVSNKMVYENIEVPKGNYYTFSLYIKNNVNSRIKLLYNNQQNETIEELSDTISPNLDFVRKDVTIYYPEDATSSLKIGVVLENIGIAYIDNLQLEDGKTSNKYNFITNSNFENGIDWDISAYDSYNDLTINANNIFESVLLPDGINALKVKMNPAYNTDFSKTFEIDGSAGDVYKISFWYKNEGLINPEEEYCNNVIINFDYTNPEEYGHFVFPSISLNPNRDEWQFFSEIFEAEDDYESLTVSFFESHNANNLYITNLSLEKDYVSKTYNYDKDGNVTDVYHFNKGRTSYKYDSKNNVVSVKKRNNISSNIEYSSINNHMAIRSILNDNMNNNCQVDDNGNISKKYVSINEQFNFIDGFYRIKTKGENKWLHLIDFLPKFVLSDYINDNWHFETEMITEQVEQTIINQNEEEEVILVDEEVQYFKISHNIIQGLYLSNINNNIRMNQTPSLFLILENNDGSYCIKDRETGLFLCEDNGNLLLSNNSDSDLLKFYIEKNTIGDKIQEEFRYSTDGKYLIESIDPLMKSKKSMYNLDNGNVNKLILPDKSEVYITYNEKNQITSIRKNNEIVEYTYDGSLLTYINYNDIEYNLVYDEFNNLVVIKVNDEILYSVSISNNIIRSSSFGYNTLTSYYYNEFNKLINMTKNLESYEIIYDNNGNIRKILNPRFNVEYLYDVFNRIYEYVFNDFHVRYLYNDVDSVKKRQYILDNTTNSVEYIGDEINNSLLIDNNIEYNYYLDEFDRIYNSGISGIIDTNYTYLKNGKKQSLIPNCIENNQEKIYYKFDNNYNIKNKYINNVRVNSYKYNENNELIEDNDYIRNTKTVFKYDQYGNMLSKKVLNLDTFELIKKDVFGYENQNNPTILTKLNENQIITDNIGNPISIGNDIEMVWSDSRILSEYHNLNNNILFEYDMNDYRTKKIVNNNVINFYYENDKLIYQKDENNILYFIRDYSGELIGFKYNNNYYYYKKNLEEDIIGIIDSLGNIIANYSYDSWGNILDITDSNGDSIMNQNNHIAIINPFRYRSYYYDVETNLYYLGKRYYSPELHRFLSIDNKFPRYTSNMKNFNLYLYCNNNPVNSYDDNGTKLSDWISKQSKKLKNTVTNAWNGVKTAVKTGWECTKKGIEKVKNFVKEETKSIKESLKWAKDHLIIEGGIGLGLSGGGKSTPASGGYYNDMNFGIKEGKTYESSSVKAYGKLGTAETGYEFVHYDHEYHDYDHMINATNPVTVIPLISDCEYQSSDFYIERTEGFLHINSNGEIFAGIDLELHFIVGGHIRIGFIDEY